MKIRQAILIGKSQAGEMLTLTTWLDVRPDLQKGVRLTLKEYPDIEWTVFELYDHEHEAADFDFHRKWDNNNYDKHRGLKV